MDLHLEGKVAAVGGGSAGLGLATAAELVREGANVVIASRSASRVREAAATLRRMGGRGEVTGLAADLATEEGCRALVDTAVQRHGGLDCLLLNAGGPAKGYALDADDAAWRLAFDLVVLSAVRQVRLAVPHMVARGGGRILAVTSTSVRQPIPDLVLSNALRSAVVTFLKSVANEYTARGVLVNCLAPGRIATERIVELDTARAQREGVPAEEIERRHLANIPAGRYGTAQEYGRVAAFLLSFANTYISGAHVYVDGGMVKTPM